MTNQDLINLYEGLDKVKDLKGFKFAYAVVRNSNKIKTEITNLEETLKTTEKFNEFETKRIELNKKYAKKDEKGEPIIEKDAYILENKEEFEKEYELLKEEYKEEITKREEQNKELVKFLKEETTFELFKVKKEDVPQDITPAQMGGIISIIEE